MCLFEIEHSFFGNLRVNSFQFHKLFKTYEHLISKLLPLKFSLKFVHFAGIALYIPP